MVHFWQAPQRRTGPFPFIKPLTQVCSILRQVRNTPLPFKKKSIFIVESMQMSPFFPIDSLHPVPAPGFPSPRRCPWVMHYCLLKDWGKKQVPSFRGRRGRLGRPAFSRGLCQRLHPWVRGENSLQLKVVVMGSEGGHGSCRNAEI